MKNKSSDQIEKLTNAIYQGVCALSEAALVNNSRTNLANTIGSVGVNGKEYQIQISFVQDKSAWINPDAITHTEVVKVHENTYKENIN